MTKTHVAATPGDQPAATAASSAATSAGRSGKRKDSAWEILGSLEKGVAYTIKPKRYEACLLKRRKWPLKGWHKRFFVMDQGVLLYGKSSADIARGRTLGKFNIGEAVISANYAEMRIDIDAEESVHHVKANNMEEFGLFLEQLQQHRLYTQHLSNSGSPCIAPIMEEEAARSPLGFSRTGSLSRQPLRGGRCNLLAEFTQLDEHLYRSLDQLQSQVSALLDTLGRLEDADLVPGHKKRLFHLRKKKSTGASMNNSRATGSSDRASPVLPNSSQELDMDPAAGSLVGMASLSNSNQSLNTLTSSNTAGSGGSRPTSFPGGDVSTLRSLRINPSDSGSAGSTSSATKEEALQLVQDMQAELAGMTMTYLRQRDQLKQMIDNETKSASLQPLPPPQVAVVASLRQSLNAALQQNAQLRTRLARIHAESDMGETPSLAATTATTSATSGPGEYGGGSLMRGMNNSLSYSSSCISEFFDAREYADSGGGDTDDDVSDTDFSDTADSAGDEEEEEGIFLEPMASMGAEQSAGDKAGSGSSGGGTVVLTGRRRTLPVPKTDTEGVNLWNLLCKNIGKDLSKISMPVTLNEPLSALQRICEELEYVELVEKAVRATTALERLQWVVAFSVSAYGSCNARASQKPFNPLLGETYECVRDDMGFSFLAEQVSHHPPVSVAHASGAGWTWTQALRIRSKFWGKSMEFQPEGKVQLTLKLADGSEETYTWNKITTCIHNILGAERWVDLYGECLVSCQQSGLTARLQFVRASYWSSKRHELFGTITDATDNVVQNMFGKWSEALYVGKAPSARCIWRPGALPDDAHLYYGFSRFAMELNELIPKEVALLPPTDTRWRPDQRALEEGRISEAENIKLGVEQAQRDRRRARENGEYPEFVPLWFANTSGEENGAAEVEGEDHNPDSWTFNGQYWTKRASGFQGVRFEPLW